MKMKISKSFFVILLSVLIVISIFLNIYWMQNNKAIQGMDVGGHSFFSIDFYYKIYDITSNADLPLYKKPLQILCTLYAPLKHSPITYPHWVYFTTSGFYSIFGRNLLATRLNNIVYLIILIFSVFFIGKHLVSQRVGVLAVFILMLYPLIFESSRQYGLDLPLTSIVALSFLLLIKSDSFRNRKYSILLGITAGIGMLVKGQFAIFLLGPVIYFIYGLFASWTRIFNKINLAFIFLLGLFIILDYKLSNTTKIFVLGQFTYALYLILISIIWKTMENNKFKKRKYAILLIFTLIIIYLCSGMYHFFFISVIVIFTRILIYYIGKTHLLNRNKYTILLLYTISLGVVLRRGQLNVFIIFPAILSIFKIITTETITNRKVIKNQLLNFLIFTFIFSLITYFWWGINADSALNIMYYVYPKLYLQASPLHNIGLCLNDLKYSSMGIVQFFIFLITLFVFLKGRINQKNTYLIWLFIPLAYFLLAGSCYDGRYLMPIFPVIAVITSYGIIKMKNKFGSALCCSIIAYSCFQFYILTFNNRSNNPSVNSIIKGTTYSTTFMKNIQYNIADIIKIFREHSTFKEKTYVLAIIAAEELHPAVLKYWVRMENHNLVIYDFWEMFSKINRYLEREKFIIICSSSETEFSAQNLRAILLSYYKKYLRQNYGPSINNRIKEYWYLFEEYNTWFDENINKFDLIAEIKKPECPYKWTILKKTDKEI